MINKIQKKIDKITIVSATKLPENQFWRRSFLGRSLRRMPKSTKLSLDIYYGNQGDMAKGLSEVYNIAINKAGINDILIFIHDDVYLHDWFLPQRVIEGLRVFSIVGLAGAVNPDLSQPAWMLAFDGQLNPIKVQKDVFFSGSVNHCDYGYPSPDFYGISPQKCRLLDGLFLAVTAKTLQQHNLCFDEKFKFHLYDLDFCRNADARGLTLGTWPIAVTHESGGDYNAPEFKLAASQYLKKWVSSQEAIKRS